MNPLSAIRQIDYTVIYTSDVLAMRHFYEKVLGFPLVRELSAHWIEFQIGVNTLAISARTGRFDDRPPPSGALSVQLAFRVEPSQVDECAQHLVHWGVDVLSPPTSQMFGHRTFFFRDPDGNVLEIYGEL